jgi:hypothetical protein
VPSPDGRNLAIIGAVEGRNRLWVRPLAAESAHLVERSEGADMQFWSPDSQSIGFFIGNTIRRWWVEVFLTGSCPSERQDDHGLRLVINWPALLRKP